MLGENSLLSHYRRESILRGQTRPKISCPGAARDEGILGREYTARTTARYDPVRTDGDLSGAGLCLKAVKEFALVPHLHYSYLYKLHLQKHGRGNCVKHCSDFRNAIDGAKYAPFGDGAFLVAVALCPAMRGMPLPSVSAQKPPRLMGNMSAKRCIIYSLHESPKGCFQKWLIAGLNGLA